MSLQWFKRRYRRSKQLSVTLNSKVKKYILWISSPRLQDFQLGRQKISIIDLVSSAVVIVLYSQHGVRRIKISANSITLFEVRLTPNILLIHCREIKLKFNFVSLQWLQCLDSTILQKVWFSEKCWLLFGGRRLTANIW